MPQVLLPSKSMTISRPQATLITVCYSDIFDYPLTSEELTYWLVFYKGKPSPDLLEKNSYYFLPTRKRIVSIRKKREVWSKKKWQIAKKIVWIYKLVPTILLVGVTGGLTMNNVKSEDDIDLFFIVHPKTLWISRLLATLLTESIGMRRRPGDKRFSDKVCLNMFMTSDRLRLVQKERDLFAAHEVLQMVPLWEKNNVYQKFLRANKWVEKFLPNAWDKNIKNENLKLKNENSILQIFEYPAKLGQLWYMRRHRTSEVVTDTVIRFHPRDARVWVKEKLERRLQRQNLPLDKIFFNR